MGSIAGSAIGYANGNGYLPLVWIYWFCAVINVLVGVFGWMALSGRRNYRPPKPPPAWGLPQTSNSNGFFSGFKHAPFAALFTSKFTTNPPLLVFYGLLF